MIKTKKNKKDKINKNKTIRQKTYKIIPELKILKEGYKLYGAKNKNLGFKILEYTEKNEQKQKKECVYENISWFADLKQAKHYKKKDDEIFKWNIKKNINLVKITEKNRNFFKNLFLNTKKKIKPVIKISKLNELKVNYEHPFLKMSNNEKALYEFEFIFGYISLKEQYEFLLFIKYLIEHQIFDILSRHNSSLLSKINKKINFYKLYPFGKKEDLNRVSLYQINKQSLLNLCMMTNESYKIDGVYQPNTNSYWYPDLIVYHMNIEEFILFSPHKNLENDGIV